MKPRPRPPGKQAAIRGEVADASGDGCGVTGRLRALAETSVIARDDGRAGSAHFISRKELGMTSARRCFAPIGFAAIVYQMQRGSAHDHHVQ